MPVTLVNSLNGGRFRPHGFVAFWIFVLLLGCNLAAWAQPPGNETNSSLPRPTTEDTSLDSERPPINLKTLPRNLFQDQKDFWLTPFHMTKREWQWTVPLTFAGAFMLGSDTAIERHLPTSSTTISHASTASNVGAIVLVGAGAGMFAWGHLTNNDQERETGILSGEAGIDAVIEAEVLKYATRRQRPYTVGSRGLFFHGGDSFPSEHAAVSWAIASVIAHEYPGPFTQLLAYGVAGSVSAARVIGQKHFATDALVGSALGWYTGWQVFRSHSHYSAAEIARYGTFTKSEEEDTGRQPGDMGSSYVPLDSWVYPVFDRLIALGYARDRTGSLRPWSRLECARILADVHKRLEDQADDMEAQDAHIMSMVRDLDQEFGSETELRTGTIPNVNAELESVYSRYTGISGEPLRDSYHFAQTITDDFGRPYGRGFNNITGISTRTAVGPFVLYVRGEYQYGSSSQEYTAAQAQDIASFDNLPVNSVPTFGSVSRLRTVEAYAGLNIENWQFTFGQQALWWGFNRSTTLLLSNNAQAIPMLRVDRVSPLRLPSVLGFLGPMQVSGFIGRLGGHRYLRLGPNFVLFGDGIHQVDPQPYIWGANIAFKPTSNLELGFSITTVFAGFGRPATLKTFFHSFSQHGNAQPVDPGDRSPGMSASYRLPGLRDAVTLYADSFSETQPFPLFFPLESAVNAGIYLSHLPRLKNLDFRCEGLYTNIPGRNANNNSYFINEHYAEGNRNYGQLYTSWIGRGGNGGQASTTYWFSGHNQVTLAYRRMMADGSLLKGGNTDDISGSLTWMVRPHIEVAGSLQYERWNFPELNPGPRTNLSSTIEIRVWPKLRAGPGSSASGGSSAHP